MPILLFFIGSANLTGILINLLIVPMVPVITIGGFVSVVLGSLSGWSFWTVPIAWLLELVFYLSAWAEEFSLRVEIEQMRVKWAFLLIMIGLGICAVRILYQKKIGQNSTSNEKDI